MFTNCKIKVLDVLFQEINAKEQLEVLDINLEWQDYKDIKEALIKADASNWEKLHSFSLIL